MWKALMFAISLLTLTATTAAQERRPWSFYIEGGAGIQQLAELKGIAIPEGEAKEYLNKRGIYSLNITTGIEKPVVPNFNIGISFAPQSILSGRFRTSLHLGNQNISQKSYHAAVASGELLFGYDLLRHPHHDLSIEVGAGAYATFNSMRYTWRGLDGEGKQIYIGGVPEQITVDLGWHNTVQLSIPARVSYTYNVGGSSWLGVYVQGRYIPRHDSYVPTYTASAGIQYRYTLGKKKQTYIKETRPRASAYNCPPRVDTVYVTDTVFATDTVYVTDTVTVAVHDTVFVEKAVEKRRAEYILFEIGSYKLTEFESKRLSEMDIPAQVELVGFACEKGDPENNKKLAANRVNTVKKVLELRGVKVISTSSHVSNYVAPNFRCVEIKTIEN